MRKALWKPPGTLYFFLAFGVLMAMITIGCAQDGGSAQTTVTEEGLTAEETTPDEGSTAQRTQGSGQEETTQEEQPSDQQGEQQTITVRITGTEGLSFVGRVGSYAGSEGTAQDLQRIQGSVPEEYEIPFKGTVTASVRKQEPGEGTLGAEVVRNGRVVASEQTSTTTGVLNVGWTSQ